MFWLISSPAFEINGLNWVQSYRWQSLASDETCSDSCAFYTYHSDNTFWFFVLASLCTIFHTSNTTSQNLIFHTSLSFLLNRNHTCILTVWCATWHARFAGCDKWKRSWASQMTECYCSILQINYAGAPISFTRNAYDWNTAELLWTSWIGKYKREKNVFQITFIFHCQNWDKSFEV